MNRADYFNVDSDALMQEFLVRLISYSFTFKCRGSIAVAHFVLNLLFCKNQMTDDVSRFLALTFYR